MSSLKNDFLNLALLAYKTETLKKLVFSQKTAGEINKVSARLCSHRHGKVLALEFSLPGNTVSQKNISEENLTDELFKIFENFKQANLITTLGDAEYKISKSGKEVLLGADALLRKLSGEKPNFVSAIEELDKRKNYILTGDEDFLKTLGISDKTGRVHDKKQGKFRQINRFLEHIEDIYDKLPKDRKLIIYDLCCGKSYLSFAVYYYLTKKKNREVSLLGIDLKRDVIDWCSSLAKALSWDGMTFVYDDIRNTPKSVTPDMVISLHACDIATDIVIDTAIKLHAEVILSTPCCHRYLNDKIKASELSFVTEHPHLKNKLCEAITDALRIARLRSFGYKVSALELTDPENTPKNTLIRAVLNKNARQDELSANKARYEQILDFLLLSGKEDYLSEIK